MSDDQEPVSEPEAAAETEAPSAPAGPPRVSLGRLEAAAQGGRYPSGVKPVQAALARLRLLPESGATSGTFDSATMQGYRALQAHLGFGRESVTGLPDSHSLTWLALRTGLFQMEG